MSDALLRPHPDLARAVEIANYVFLAAVAVLYLMNRQAAMRRLLFGGLVVATGLLACCVFVFGGALLMQLALDA